MPKTVYVTREVHFCAAHRLHNPSKPEQWNKDTFGLCNSLNYHGHNYRLEVTVRGEVDPDTGFVIELGNLKRILEEEICNKCDHKNLNLDVPFLSGIIPSTENLAMVFWELLKGKLPSGELYQIKIFETERNWVEYRGPTA
ncbi:MAG: 6-carboxytetrahydropterin synthase [Proteobacteria bacterium]|nr:6-carboxytetrahydropterin synthase [Pseudomonadota bacterium]